LVLFHSTCEHNFAASPSEYIDWTRSSSEFLILRVGRPIHPHSNSIEPHRRARTARSSN
jgi:hypothetical protein